MYVIVKGLAKDIIKQYHNLIGKPKLLPMWSIGWQAGGNYDTHEGVEANINGYKASGLPLEGVWIDQHYLSNFSNFDVNTTAFPNLGTLVTDL